MPWSRPTLSDLIDQAAADINSTVSGADARLRFSNLNVIARLMAGLAHQHYGYEDWIARMGVPFTAKDEFLAAWAAFKNVFLKPATQASVQVQFTGCTTGTSIPINTPLVRGDGIVYTCTVAGNEDGSGNILITVQANVAGAAGNSDIGVVLTLGVAIAGVPSNGAVSAVVSVGADVETENEFYNRMLEAYQNPPQGGSATDYVLWAKQVTGVTRAWCRPNGSGPGSVIVYFMEDDVRAGNSGFPIGTNGVATAETRAAPAFGDQLAVANYIFPLEPVTALVYASAPSQNAVVVTISGLSGATTATKDAVEAALDDMFFRLGSPGAVYLPDDAVGGTIDISDFEDAITSVPNTGDFILVAPAANVTSADGALPIRGTTTFP